MRHVGLCIVTMFMFYNVANAAQTSNGASGTQARAQYCAKAHPADFYDLWLGNHCTKAPYGPKFEYLTPAWNCLCRGTE